MPNCYFHIFVLQFCHIPFNTRLDGYSHEAETSHLLA